MDTQARLQSLMDLLVVKCMMGKFGNSAGKKWYLQSIIVTKCTIKMRPSSSLSFGKFW